MKPEMRHKLAQLPSKKNKTFSLRQEIKTDLSEESLDKAAAELDSGKGIPLDRVRENIREWAKNPNK